MIQAKPSANIWSRRGLFNLLPPLLPSSFVRLVVVVVVNLIVNGDRLDRNGAVGHSTTVCLYRWAIKWKGLYHSVGRMSGGASTISSFFSLFQLGIR